MWTQEEKKLLAERFRFLVDESLHIEAVKLTDMIDEDALGDFLKKEASQIGSDQLKVAASIFMKRYAFLLVGALASWSFFRKLPALRSEKVCLTTHEKNGNWMLEFAVGSELSANNDPKEWLSHMGKVVEALRKTTKLPNLVAWENVAIYIFWLYETVAEDEAFSSVRVRAKADFDWLLSDEQASSFGDYHANPLARYDRTKIQVKGRDEKIKVRKTCCFNYLLDKPGAKNCKTCPKVCVPVNREKR
ncbi:IucA/IucC family C-terminal-domain containing protein [Bacillus sp. B190/17]|uniref:IucA/IucC family C-terminal-domain containing protein n=1 Tax=Bacillus lumedeiriae TaxID=3058829 RepID=A0ABW8IAD7_9BACI